MVKLWRTIHSQLQNIRSLFTANYFHIAIKRIAYKHLILISIIYRNIFFLFLYLGRSEGNSSANRRLLDQLWISLGRLLASPKCRFDGVLLSCVVPPYVYLLRELFKSYSEDLFMVWHNLLLFLCYILIVGPVKRQPLLSIWFYCEWTNLNNTDKINSFGSDCLVNGWLL